MRSILRFNSGQWPQLASSITLSAASLGAAMGLLATSAWLISEASTRPPVLVLEVAIVAVRTFGLSRGALKYVSRILEHDVALKTQSELRARMYENLRRLSALSFGQLRRGHILQQLVQDVDTSQDLWLRLWSPWLSALITGVAGIGLIFALIPEFGMVLSVLFALAIGAAPLVARVAGSSTQIREEESQLFDQIMQSFQSVDESLIFGYQGRLLKQVQEKQSQISTLDRRAARWAGVASAGYAKTLGISLLFGTLFASNAYAHKHIAGVNVAVVILLPLAIFDGVSTLPLAFSRALRVREAIDAIEPLLADPFEDGAEGLGTKGLNLELKNFEPLLPGKTLPTFSHVVKPGTPWIVRGASGFGKSSLLLAMLGFIEHRGDLMIDGVPVNSLDTSQATTLLQDDHLFITSIKENLKIGNSEASDEELLEILKFVELEELISSLPDGIDTLIGESGFNFSGGEKQRIKLARVLLRDTDIYLLDEPFEYLGLLQAERLSRKVFERLSKKTVVIVSHLEI